MKTIKLKNESASKNLRAFIPRGVTPTVGQLRDDFQRFTPADDLYSLVYIPDIILDDYNKTHYISFSQHLTYTKDKHTQHTCIKGVQGDAYERIIEALKRDQGDNYVDLNYTGSCPLCDETGRALDAASSKYTGILESRGAILSETEIQQLKKTIRKEVAIQSSEEYVTFPIVLIPRELTGNSYSPHKVLPGDWLDTCKILMVVWHKKYYEKKLCAMLTQHSEYIKGTREQYKSPTGLLWHWSYFVGERNSHGVMQDALLVPVMRKESWGAADNYSTLYSKTKKLDAAVLNYMKDKKDSILTSLYVPIPDVHESVDTLMLVPNQFLSVTDTYKNRYLEHLRSTSDLR